MSLMSFGNSLSILFASWAWTEVAQRRQMWRLRNKVYSCNGKDTYGICIGEQGLAGIWCIDSGSYRNVWLKWHITLWLNSDLTGLEKTKIEILSRQISNLKIIYLFCQLAILGTYFTDSHPCFNHFFISSFPPLERAHRSPQLSYVQTFQC